MPFLTASTPSSVPFSLWTFLATPRGIATGWLVLINLTAFFTFGWDKWKAKWKEHHENARRVPEKSLFLLAIAGGSVGALLGMRVFHHKTLHKSFRFGIPAILLTQILIVLGVWVYTAQRGTLF